MTNANTHRPDEDDFQFHERDLRDDQEPGLRAEADEHMEGLDAPRTLDDDLYNEATEHGPVEQAQPAQKSFLSKFGMYICVGVVAVGLFSGLGFVAYLVLKPAPLHAQRSGAPEPFGAQGNMPAALKNSAAVEPVRFDDESGNQSNVQGQYLELASDKVATDDPGTVLPITPRTEQEQDEQFYDTLVSAAGENTPPAQVQAASPTQVATPVLVAPETADKFAAISVAIANQSKEMGTVLEAIKSVSSEIKSLKAQVDASSTKTNLFEGKLNQLTLSLGDLTKNAETRFNDISKAAVAAAVQAVKKESVKNPGANGKLVLVGGPIKSDYTAANSAKRIETKVPPKPMVVAAQPPVVSAPAPAKSQVLAEPGNQAAKCGARTISQVWKVKGLTFSGAYVRRDDGSALMLRADMEVPGFGRVKSFDPESRTVCTTSGLIAR